MNLKRFIPFLTAFALPLLLIYAWWGGFNTVSLETAVRGPYTYAYLENVGDYSKLPEKQEQVQRGLGVAGIQPGLPITVLFSNPDVVNVNERRGRAGFLVPVGTTVREPMRIDHIPARSVLVARIKAGSLLAPGLAYSALDEHMQAQGSGIRMPTVEIYQSSGKSTEMGVLTVEMPI